MPTSIVIAFLLALGLPGGGALGNHAALDVSAPGSAAASCQLYVLVGSIVVLDVEDGLGLVALPPAQTLGARLAQAGAASESIATCSSVIERLVVRVPAGSGLGGTFVSGPALHAEPVVSVTGEGSDAAACEYAVVVDSIVMGGGAFGFPTGDAAGILSVAATTAPRGTASCEAAIREIVLEEFS